MSEQPIGTKAWRKSHRRKWRDGSSYRELTLLEREVLRWVEDNADDAGQVTTTMRYLADMVSPQGQGHRKIPYVSVWRAVQRCVREDLLTTEVVAKVKQNSERKLKQGPTKITRVNFREYQERPEAGETAGETDVSEEVKLSGRGRQKKQTSSPAGAVDGGPAKPTKPKGGPIPPAFFATLAAAGYSVEDKGRFAALRLAREGVPWVDITTRAVLGLAYCHARTVWFALSNEMRSKVTDPQFNLEAADVRAKFTKLAQAEVARGSSPRRVDAPGAEPAPAPRLPDPGPDCPPIDEPTLRVGGTARDVQDGHHAHLDSQPRPLREVRDGRAPGDGRGSDSNVLPIAAVGHQPK